MAKPKKITERDIRLGRYIQKLRKGKNITQEQLAQKLGVSVAYVGYLEIGYRRPSLLMMYKIARALDLKVSDLFPF